MKINRLMLATVLLTVGLSAQAGSHAEKGQFMQYMTHANPVPNYVSVIKKQGKVLGLSEAQMSQVMAWNTANNDKMHKMVMSVIEGEKKMKQASMAGVSTDEIITMAKQLSETRVQIVSGKTHCRDHIKSVLNEAQWQQLTAMIAAK